ncbi:MAG: DUF2703 domain-containing protein [Acidobacteria bacterium]|nr:MAG: DUF2703 domain-containing protein [Acidobacteriota bacterium]
MKITLLHNESCPSTSDALERLNRVLERLGEDAEVEVILVSTEAEARERGFLGSPTILVNGADIEVDSAAGSDANPAAFQACRIYRRPDGRVSPLPPEELIEQAIQRSRDAGS